MTDEEKAAAAAKEKEGETEKLKAQVGDLTKGIATYRDEAKAAKDEAAKASKTATDALSKLAEFEGLFNKKEKGVELTDEEEKKLSAYAQKHGLLTKADLDKTRVEATQAQVKGYEDQAVSEFLEAHPEYDDDEKWKAVMTEFALYRQPVTLTAYKALLQRIHKDLSEEESGDAQARARAAIINRSKLGLGGGRQATTEDEVEARIDSLHKKYPHLSRELIVERLAEIDKLPVKKK